MSPINIHFIAFLWHLMILFRFLRRKDDDDVKSDNKDEKLTRKIKKTCLKIHKLKISHVVALFCLFKYLVWSKLSSFIPQVRVIVSWKLITALRAMSCAYVLARNFREQRDDEQRIENVKIENYMLSWNKKTRKLSLHVLKALFSFHL